LTPQPRKRRRARCCDRTRATRIERSGRSYRFRRRHPIP
jgi:hypothetical protein